MPLPKHVTPHDLIDAIESFSITERGKQTQIGPSEVGMACQRCIVRKLANMEREQVTGSWRAQLGTYVHAGLEQEFASRFHEQQIMTERKLLIHTYKDLVLAGSCDLFAPNEGRGLVADWKIVGDDTLRMVAQGKVKAQYFTQGHLYGFGYEQLGFPVETIAIMFLPANKGNLQRDAVIIEYPYDRNHALRALAKLEAYIDHAEDIGWPALLRMTPPEPGCLSCANYVGVDNPVHDLLLR